MAGFDGADFVAGTVTGFRWWTLAAPDFMRHPLAADEHWPPSLLAGMQDDWQPGVNTAICKALSVSNRHARELVPYEPCGCGFWAYWELQSHSMGAGAGKLPVCGVIEGFGQVLIGERGFRAARARIVALHVAVGSLVPLVAAAPETVARPETSTADVLRRHLPASKVYGDGETLDGTRMVPSQDPEHIAWADAWMAVLGDRLGQLYPGARIFENQDELVRRYPSDPAWLEPLNQPGACPICEHVIPAGTDLDTHVYQCSQQYLRLAELKAPAGHTSGTLHSEAGRGFLMRSGVSVCQE